MVIAVVICGEKGTFSKTLSGAGRRGTISRRGGSSFEVKTLDEGKTSRDKVEGKGMNVGEWSGQSRKENMMCGWHGLCVFL